MILVNQTYHSHQFKDHDHDQVLVIITNSDVKSSKPNRVKNHVKNIKPLRRRIDLKMSPHFQHSPLHSYVLPGRYARQDPLQVRNVLHRDLDRERFPVQDVAERRDVVVGDEHRDAAGVDRLHNPRAGHFVPARANAELALSQHVVVRDPLGEVLLYFHVLVFVLPVL